MTARPISWLADADLLDSAVTNVSTAKIYLLVRGRNAWHSTWSKRFRGTNAIHLTLRDAKNDAGRQRVQGSTFTIREVPALRLHTERGSVLAIEFHSDNCFGQYTPPPHATRLVGEQVRYAIARLNGLRSFWRAPAISEHSFQQVFIGDTEPEHLAPRKPLAYFTSNAWSAQYSLGWSAHRSTYSRRGINRIVRANQQPAAASADPIDAVDASHVAVAV